VLTTRSRFVLHNETVLCQADFLGPDVFTRVPSLTVPQVGFDLFYNNTVMPWTPVDGTAVSDAQVVSGKIYWSEIPSRLGFYSVRFRPNAVGYWRLVLTYASGLQTYATDYDVLGTQPNGSDGLQYSFVKGSC
jgi:hypothetical protein